MPRRRRHRPKIAFSYAKLDILDASFPTDAQRHIQGLLLSLFFPFEAKWDSHT